MGLFLTVEGPDGAGKTTQIELLRDYLSDKGYDIIVCREPGGTPISEAVRNVILNKEFTEMGHMTELLLYAAARAQLIEEVIRPALEDGKIVICDRFVESSAVYQGIARGMGIDLVYKVNQFAIGDTMPDLTIMIDLDAEAGISRKKKQAELMATLAVGDSVLTSSGFYGVIIDMTDDTVIVEFGSNKNCRIPMRKDAIVQVEKPEV